MATKKSILAKTKPKPRRNATDPSAAVVRSDDAILAEALRRGREVVQSAESLLEGYGQWLFANVFGGDTRLVLDAKVDHPVWAKLLAAAEGAKLPLGRGTLSATLRIAALDKRLADAPWTSLGYSLKVALLPLQTPIELRAAARHVLASGLSVRATMKYVDNTLHPDGKPARLSPTTARKTLRRLAAPFSRPNYVEKLESALNKLDDDKRADAKASLASLVKQLQQLLKGVRARGTK